MAGIGLEELRSAVLSAAITLTILGILALARRLRRKKTRNGGASIPPEASVLRAEASRVEAELRALTAEVEGRLDTKMDRLESLLKQAQAVESMPRASEPVRRLSTGGPRWDPLGTVSGADRNRVLELASLGELPDAIAGSVGLLRGEVDLILRLHRSSERSEAP